ncbi:MAG: DUF255 domain-containing protein, partial [Armatimonadota bacterium]
PYLLQHAHNPVDWYPWGEEAFERARREDKPIFLSIGYSTCHWCHVMERESFEDEEIAAFLNAHFICIKVDREERPDIDSIYMMATQISTGGGGWPNSVWLTPDGRPWFAGTYFPPEDRFGRPGFKTILARLADVWETRRADVEAQADEFVKAIKQISSSAGKDAQPLDRGLVSAALEGLRASFDTRFGGFGGAPKFPPHNAMRLILHEYRRTKEPALLEIITRTLDRMAEGGIRDHVGGGFHRYSTDARWFLPHFEKMLYDNAMLSRAYVEAYRLTGNDEYAQVAAETYDWVLREMTDESGAFYSALDADSEGEEGKFYVWSRDEIINVLGQTDGELFCRVYHVQHEGNFEDEATGRRPGTNILYLSRPIEQTAKAERLPEDELRSRLDAARRKLLRQRAKRVWPSLDDKTLTAWNGLMIGSLAFAGRHLEEPRYMHAAERAANFILTVMRDDERLFRAYRAGEAGGNAYLDDYAFLADGLLDLYDTTADERWLREAKAVADAMLRHFADEVNGVAARVLIRLGRATGGQRYQDEAKACLTAFGDAMRQAPRGTESLLLALAMYLGGPTEVAAAIAGKQPTTTGRIRPLTAAVFVPDEGFTAGGEADLRLRLVIDDGWHVNSHEPAQGDLIPTSVAVEGDSITAVREVAYPRGTDLKLPFEDEPLSVYDGEVWIRIAADVSDDAPPGPTKLRVSVRFQACDDRRCLAPKTLRLEVPAEVVPSDEAP